MNAHEVDSARAVREPEFSGHPATTVIFLERERMCFLTPDRAAEPNACTLADHLRQASADPLASRSLAWSACFAGGSQVELQLLLEHFGAPACPKALPCEREPRCVVEPSRVVETCERPEVDAAERSVPTEGERPVQ